MSSAKSSGPQTFEELLAPVPDSVRKLAGRLRDCIKAALPDADETFHGGAKLGMALYSVGGPNSVVCGIQPTDGMCKLFFHGWKQLAEHGYRVEGSGKHARHLKLRSAEEVDSEAIARMVRIARTAIGK